ncbi:hypothetical protein [Mucilaginibacter sp. CSA2-8R]
MMTALFFYIVAFMLIFSAVMIYNNYKLRKKEMVPVRVVARKASQHSTMR